jgi:hypothetical protein
MLEGGPGVWVAGNLLRHAQWLAHVSAAINGKGVESVAGRSKHVQRAVARESSLRSLVNGRGTHTSTHTASYNASTTKSSHPGSIKCKFARLMLRLFLKFQSFISTSALDNASARMQGRLHRQYFNIRRPVVDNRMLYGMPVEGIGLVHGHVGRY